MQLIVANCILSWLYAITFNDNNYYEHIWNINQVAQLHRLINCL